jgi:ubiquinone/menaquinone biosynthesis C-methylase UbiE
MVKKKIITRDLSANQTIDSIDDYDKKIIMEAAFWGQECSRPRGVCSNPVSIWDDPKVESIMRGEYQDFIIQKATEKQNNRVLELGCGAGWLSLAVAQRGVGVDAYDLSPQLIQIANDKIATFSQNPRFKAPCFKVQDLNTIILEPNTYDVVMVWDSLHHILESQRLLQEVHKGLKQTGSLLMLDHVHQLCLSGKLLSLFFQGILPTDLSYCKKMSKLLVKIKNKMSHIYQSTPPIENNYFCSPFEDCTGIEMIDYINQFFTIHKLTFLLSFSHHFVARIRISDSIRLPLIRLLKYLDNVLIRLGLFKGEYVFVWAAKK